MKSDSRAGSLASLDPRRLLESPAAYRLLQSALTRHRQQAEFVEQYVKPEPGMSVLDIGCGPGDLVSLLPDVNYVGFDVSASYIAAARKRHGSKAKFFESRVSSELLAGERFDVIVAKAILHHLDDQEAADLFSLSYHLLSDSGWIVTLDPCYHDGQGWLARRFADADRGNHVRFPNEYERLAAIQFSDVTMIIRGDLMRIPYSHVIVTATK